MGSTQQPVASVLVGAVVPQRSMMEVFSRATKRLASTQSKLPHHSGLPLTSSMLPMALNASQVACSVMVLQTTETDEEAEQFVQRQASLSNEREVEGFSTQAESRAALLKDDTPVSTKRIGRVRPSMPWQLLPRWRAKLQLSLGWVIPTLIERKASMSLEQTVLGTGGVTRVAFRLTWRKGARMRSIRCATMLIPASCFRLWWQLVHRQCS